MATNDNENDVAINNLFDIVKRGAASILQKEYFIELEELFRKVYIMVCKGHGEMIHTSIKDVIKTHLVEVIRPAVINASNIELLPKLIECWNEYNCSLEMIRDASMYLEVFIRLQKKDLQTVTIFGLQMFLDEIVLDPTVNCRMKSEMFNIIETGRQNKKAEMSLLKPACKMLLTLGFGNRAFYEDQFENVFLQKSAEYCRSKCSIFMSEIDALKFVDKIFAFINTEELIGQSLIPSSHSKLINILNHELIVFNMETVIKMGKTFLSYIFETKHFDLLKKLYAVLNRFENGINIIVDPFIKYLCDEGDAILYFNTAFSSKNYVECLQCIDNIQQESAHFIEYYIFEECMELKQKIQNGIELLLKPKILSLCIDNQIQVNSFTSNKEDTENIANVEDTFKFLWEKSEFERTYNRFMERQFPGKGLTSVKDESEVDYALNFNGLPKDRGNKKIVLLKNKNLEMPDFIGSNDELLNMLTQFFQNCPKAKYREGAMNLFKKVSDSSSTIELVFQSYQNSLELNDEKFRKDVYNGSVQTNSWKDAFKVIVKLDVSKHFDVLDHVFHLKTFDNNDMERYVIFHSRRLFYDPKTFNNALEWLKRLGIKKYMNCKYEIKDNTFSIKSKTKDSRPKNVEELPWIDIVTVNVEKLHESYFKAALYEFSSCIRNFYSNCKKEWLRRATMDFIIYTDISISSIDRSDPSIVIYEICQHCERFLREKGNEFSEEVLAVEVSDDLYKKSLEVVLNQRSNKSYPIIDLLFKMNDNKKHKEMFYDIIRGFLNHPKTINNGLEKIDSFGIDLMQLKIKDQNDDDDDKPWIKNVENAFDEIQRQNYDLVKCDHELENFFNFNADSNQFFAYISVYSTMPCPKEVLRPATLEILAKMDSKNENASSLIRNICEKYAACKNITETNVSDKSWKNAWENCSKTVFIQDPNSSIMFDHLFHIVKPETEARQQVFCQSVEKMLSKSETYFTAVNWLNKFHCLKSLKEELFSRMVAYSCVFKNGKKILLDNISNEEKIRAAKILDIILKQTKANALPIYLEEHKTAFTVEKVLRYISSLTNKQKIDIKKENYFAFDELYMQNIKEKFEFYDKPNFELYMLDVFKIKEQDDKHKRLFIQSLSNDKIYACYWGEYLQISDVPRNCFISDADIKNFINEMSKRINCPVNEDSIEECKFWGKSAKLITIVTPKPLKELGSEYFVRPKPKFIGMDLEAGPEKQGVVLQVGTSECTCVIDIQELAHKLSEDEWINFYTLFFGESESNPKNHLTEKHTPILVGFAFQHDYGYLCKTFPFLKNFFKYNSRKVLDLQKLANYILKDEQLSSQVFLNEMSEDVSLAKLTYAVLGLNLDKSLQKSHWHIRPLTQFQKIYAGVDAFILVLLVEEIEKKLTKICPNRLKDIMEMGYICYED